MMIFNYLKCSIHKDYVVLKANLLLGTFYRSIQSNLKPIILLIYISLVKRL